MSEVEKKPFDPATFEGIMLEFKRVLCQVHGSPFRPAWPTGYMIFMVRAFQEVTAVPGVWDDARRLAGVPDGVAVPPKAIELVLDVRPACCRLPAKKLAALYEECKIGRQARCKVCHRKAMGTPIEAANVAYSHCCFLCVASASATPQGIA